MPRPTDPKARVYAMLFHSSEERFIKFGISQDVRRWALDLMSEIRTKGEIMWSKEGHAPAYLVSPIFVSERLPRKEAYSFETQIKRTVKSHKVVPILDFGGKTECFSYNPRFIEALESTSLFIPYYRWLLMDEVC